MHQTVNENRNKNKIRVRNFRVVGPLKGAPGKFGHKALFCMFYRCNRCRNPKLKKVRSRICEIATEHKLTRMATLTLDPKSVPGKFRGRTDRYIRECWREMRNSLAREYGKSLPFVGVLEFQKNKAAHLHVLSAGTFHKRGYLARGSQWVAGAL